MCRDVRHVYIAMHEQWIPGPFPNGPGDEASTSGLQEVVEVSHNQILVSFIYRYFDWADPYVNVGVTWLRT